MVLVKALELIVVVVVVKKRKRRVKKEVKGGNNLAQMFIDRIGDWHLECQLQKAHHLKSEVSSNWE